MIKVTMTITKQLNDKLELEMKKTGLTKSDLIRRALQIYFEKKEVLLPVTNN